MSERIQELINEQKDKRQLGNKGGLELNSKLKALEGSEVVEVESQARNKMIALAQSGGWKGLENLLKTKTVDKTEARAPAVAAPVAPAVAAPVAPAVAAPVAPAVTAPENLLDTAKTKLAKLEEKAQSLAESGNEDELAGIESQIAATKRRISVLQGQERVKEQKAYTSSIRETAPALTDAKAFDTFITTNFTKIEINKGAFTAGQEYYIANGTKNPQIAALLTKDDSTIRDIFIGKMAGVNVKIGEKGYPAIATRDIILSAYKKIENKTSLNNAVAFDARQYDKVLEALKPNEASSENTAKGITDKFITLLKRNPAEAKTFLRNAINGSSPVANADLEMLLDSGIDNKWINWSEKRGELIQNIASLLNGKKPAFVMNDTGIAFDGVSMVKGAVIRGKIEGKSPREGFYEVKSSSISDFIKDIPGDDGTIKKMITAADNKGPIELGGKIFEVKEGQVLSLGKPDGTAFSLKDCLPDNYKTSDGVRDAIIIALAVKVWGIPSLSLSLPNLSLSLPHIGSISLPHLTTAASSLLIGFGLGWFVARLVYGDDANSGRTRSKMSDYQEEYNTLTGKTGRRREALESSTGLFKDYVHMTWDVEKDEKGGTIAKIYRPLNNPVEVEGVKILQLALNKDGDVIPDYTIVKSGDKKPQVLKGLNDEKKITEKINA